MDLYTRCPHCQTVFRLTPAQIEAAGGRVRCGACLRVFPAKQHLVRPKGVDGASPAVAAKTPAASAATAAVAAPNPAPAAKPAASTAAANATPPSASTAPATASKDSKLELDFDGFFSPESASAPVVKPTAKPAAATPASQPSNAAAPALDVPDAPDFGLLAAALKPAQREAPAQTPASTPAPAPSVAAAPPTPAPAQPAPIAPTPIALAKTPVEAASSQPEPVSAPAPTTVATSIATPDHDELSDELFGFDEIADEPVVESPTTVNESTSKTAATNDNPAPAAIPPATTTSPARDADPLDWLQDSVDHEELALDDLPVTPAAKPIAPSADSAPAQMAAALEPESEEQLIDLLPPWEEPSLDAPAAPAIDSAPEATPAATTDVAAEPLFAAADEPLELELPDDWASLKSKRESPSRNEPVFDDDNGLDLDDTTPGTKTKTSHSSRIDKAASASIRQPTAFNTPVEPQLDSDHALAPEPVFEASPIVGAGRKSPTLDAPLVDEFADTASVIKPISEPVPAPVSKPVATVGKKPSIEESFVDEFELHAEAAEAAAAGPSIVGDWHLDQSDTVRPADDSTSLRATPTGKTGDNKPAPVFTTHEVHADLPADDDAIIAADFGDINNDWGKPAVAVHATERTARREPVPSPFDAEQFTADPDGRIYGPADRNDDSSNWALLSNDPRSDYEAELYPPPRKRQLPWRGLLLTVAALALLAVLISQLIWPQRAVLREDPQWGPWVETICAQIECDLPPRVDISKIQLQQKSVLKDRDDPRKLQIDLLIANKAEFVQPYPDINLRFTNIEGELVAARRFKPQEYLREQPESDQMPVNVPVHIAFSVKAPDGNVTGYEFEFLPPQAQP